MPLDRHASTQIAKTTIAAQELLTRGKDFDVSLLRRTDFKSIRRGTDGWKIHPTIPENHRDRNRASRNKRLPDRIFQQPFGSQRWAQFLKVTAVAYEVC